MVLAQDLPHARRPANAVAIGVTAVWAAQLAHRSAPSQRSARMALQRQHPLEIVGLAP